jgi:hypothetical protein
MYGYIVTGNVFLEFVMVMVIVFSVMFNVFRGKLMKHKH